MTDATVIDRLNTNIMDTWLVENDHKVRINLGESNVTDLRFGDVFPHDGPDHWIGGLTLGNNSTWGSARLRQAVAGTYPGMHPDNVLVTAGVSEAIVAVSLAHLEPDANLVIPVPAFHALIDVPEKLGYEIRKVPLDPKTNFRIPAGAIADAIDERTRIVLLNSPHNPTGAIYPHDEIVRIADIAKEAGAIVLVDEHYRYLPRDPSEEWIRSAAGARDNIVALGSVGKCFGCTGIRAGWIVASEERLELYHHYKLLVTHTIPAICDRIAAELLERRHEMLPKTRVDIAENLARLDLAASRSDGAMILHMPDAGSVAFVQLRDTRNTFAFAQSLLDEFGVLVLPGESFELPGFLRVRLGVPPTVFDQACASIETVLGRR